MRSRRTRSRRTRSRSCRRRSHAHVAGRARRQSRGGRPPSRGGRQPSWGGRPQSRARARAAGVRVRSNRPDASRPRRHDNARRDPQREHRGELVDVEARTTVVTLRGSARSDPYTPHVVARDHTARLVDVEALLDHLHERHRARIVEVDVPEHGELVASRGRAARLVCAHGRFRHGGGAAVARGTKRPPPPGDRRGR